jgi:hypothetical protein
VTPADRYRSTDPATFSRGCAREHNLVLDTGEVRADANQPIVVAGTLDTDACETSARVIWLCNAVRPNRTHRLV